MSAAEIKDMKLAPDQTSFLNWESQERIIDRLFDGYGEVQLREYVTRDGHRCWHIVYSDEHGIHHRGHAFTWKYAKKAFNTAGRRTWV